MDKKGERPNYASYQYSSVTKDNSGLHGARRVVLFCLLTAVLPSLLIVLPLYLRHIKYADVTYRVSESDVIQIHDGQSTVFCQRHSLNMNSSFHAFQMKGTPEISERRKHIRLKKSMSLPDDTLEYWGFYLLRGATVDLQACSRHEGSRILVVRGDKFLDTCGIMDYQHKVDPSIDENHGHVVVTLESPAELMDEHDAPADEADNTADELDSAEVNELERAQMMAKDRIDKHNSTHHHIKFNLKGDKGFLRDKRKLELTHMSKRDVAHLPHHILDQGFNHGGNALDRTNKDIENAMSSFENRLLECYDGNILISRPFPYSDKCTSVQHIQRTTTLKISHNISTDGYYYYIFYSDNDIVQNDIHVIFDIRKPTFQYANLSESKVCLNKTECEFPVGFLSDELVIVEVPTQDGIEHEDESWYTLTSTCHPRIYVYMIFPFAVLLLIMLFAFV